MSSEDIEDNLINNIECLKTLRLERISNFYCSTVYIFSCKARCIPINPKSCLKKRQSSKTLHALFSHPHTHFYRKIVTNINKITYAKNRDRFVYTISTRHTNAKICVIKSRKHRTGQTTTLFSTKFLYALLWQLHFPHFYRKVNRVWTIAVLF